MILEGIIWYILYFFFCLKMKYGYWWYGSSQLLVIGMFWAIYEQKIINLFKKRYITMTLLSVVLFFLFYILKTFSLPANNLTCILKNFSPILARIFFVICTLALFMKFQIGNQVLNFLGEISLELYISHGLFIIVLRSKFNYINNELIWSISVLAGTILLSYGLHILFQAILKAYKRIVLEPKVR